MRGHGGENNRPCYYSFSDPANYKIKWMVPISHEVEKYRRIYNHKTANGKRCDTLVFGEVLGQERAFLIQNMCPVTKYYLGDIYMHCNEEVMIDGRLQRAISRKARKVLSLQERGKANLIFPDVLSIRDSLLRD